MATDQNHKDQLTELGGLGSSEGLELDSIGTASINQETESHDEDHPGKLGSSDIDSLESFGGDFVTIGSSGTTYSYVRDLNPDGISTSTGTRSNLNFDGADRDAEQYNFERLLKLCGDGGKWQLKIFMLTSFCGFCFGLHNLNYAFIGATPDHWCRLPHVPNLTNEEVKTLIIPREGDKYSSCQQFEYRVTGGNLYVNRDKNVTCSSYDFDNSTFKNTIVTEYDLVCDRAWLAPTIQATFIFGILCGSPILGAFSDQYGRKKTIMITSAMFACFGPLVGFAPNIYMVMLARWLMAFASPGIYATSFVLCIETMGTEWRGLAGNLFDIPFAFGYMALPAFAYFIRDWRYLQLALCIPSFLLLVTAWLLPESPRWLLRKGKVQEAELGLREAAKFNGRKDRLPVTFSKAVAEVEEIGDEKVSSKERLVRIVKGFYYLIRSPKMRLRSSVIYFSWLSISMIYYGIALNSPNLATDLYLYTFLGGVLEIPSYVMVPPLIRFFGRRPVFSSFLFLCSLFLLGGLLFPPESASVVALSLLGKLVIGGAYGLIYLYATELVPTLLRTNLLGYASMVGRIGSVAAPFIVDLIGPMNKSYPSLIFGIFAFVAGVVSLLLPETRGKRLPETVEDIELGRV